MNEYIKLDQDEVRALRDRIDLNVVTSHVCETYGYNTNWTVNIVEKWATSAYDVSKPGFFYLGSDYVGRLVKYNDQIVVLLDRSGHEEIFSLPMKESNMQINEPMMQGAMTNPENTKAGIEKARDALDKKENPMYTNLTAHLCNVWYKNDGTPIFYKQETMVNVSGDNAKIKEEFQKVITKEDYTIWVGTNPKTEVIRHKQAVIIEGFENGKSVIITKNNAVWADKVDIRANKEAK